MKQTILVAIALLIINSFVGCNSATQNSNAEKYVCIPCGHDCDAVVTLKPGECEHCKMEMVKQSAIVNANMLPADLYPFMIKTGMQDVVLLDVRTAEEFNGTAKEKFGRLKNAINIPVQELKDRIKELENFKNKNIIVYCSHGHRSSAAAYQLTQAGFTKVINLLYGMHMWKEEVKDSASNQNLYIAQ
ncbi:MAG: rhodanese-like domain-containing protein [Ferruginibacter sp.]